MKKEFVYQVLIGILTGIVSGLFASGGGMILVPAFIYILKLKEVEARATSVLCILPMWLRVGFSIIQTIILIGELEYFVQQVEL